MPIRTRRELLRLAERYRVPIVEDGTYRELYFNEAPPPSLRDLDGQNLVIHLNSFSKVMAPGLRLGWLSAAPSIIDQIAIIKQRLDPHTQNLVQFAMARLIRERSFDAHLRTLRAEHARRCTQMIAALQRHVPAGRLALRRALREGSTCGAAWRRASARVHCSIARLRRAWRSLPGDAFYPDPAGEAELRLCFSSVTPDAGNEAIRRLAACLDEAMRTSTRSPASAVAGLSNAGLSDQLSAISCSAVSSQLVS